MFGLGGSSSSSRSSSESGGEQFGYGYDYGQTYLDPYQQQAQQQMIGQMYDGGLQGLGQTRGLEFNRQQNMQGLENLGNRAQGMGNTYFNQGQFGRQQMNQFARQNNPYLQQQIGGLAQDMGQMYREQILPGIGNEAQMAGARGSSRQGIAEALGAQRTMQEFGQAANTMRMNAYGQQQQAANALMQGGMQGSANMYGLANQANMQQGTLANQYAQTGLQGQAQPFMIGSQVIGAPQILSQQMGEDMSYGWDYSKAKSKGSSDSLNVGFGS